MPQFDEKSLKQHIRSAEFLPVYIIYGDEDYLKKNFVDLFVSKMVEPAFESLNFQRLEGKDVDLKDVFEQASIVPMMSDRRCIVVDDFKLQGISERDLGLISSYIESGCDTCSVIFCQLDKSFSTAKAKRVIDLVAKHGGVCQLDKRRGSDLTKPLISLAVKNGCVLSPQLANYLVSLVGDDFNTLVNEMQKLCFYVGEGEISQAHIDEIVVKSDEAEIKNLTLALVKKDFDKAYKVLHQLLKKKVEVNYIMGTLISNYVNMYRAKVSVYCGDSADSLQGDFQYKYSSALTNAARDASRLDISVLRKCLDMLSETDMYLKSGTDDDILALEKLMVKLFLVTNGESV